MGLVFIEYRSGIARVLRSMYEQILAYSFSHCLLRNYHLKSLTRHCLVSLFIHTHTHTHTVPLVNVCGLRDQNLLFILLFWLPLIFIPEGLKSTQITHWLVSRLVEETFEINFSCLLLLWMRESWLWLFSWFSVDWVSRVLPIISLNFNWGDTPFVNFT